jgi:cyclopropane fatty-acyl-phospholipid synthase-like methyltransferase
MAAKSLIKFILNTPLSLVFQINKTGKEFCRAGFISTALSEGIYDILSKGPASCDDIQKAIGTDFNKEGLLAWLDLGVSLGELKKSQNHYSIDGKFSKELLKPTNDTWKAFFQARVEIFHNYIINTPSQLKKHKNIDFSQSYGELFARSSRTVEPFLLDIVDEIIPHSGECSLLEVGCGSGIYIKRACDRNPNLNAVGLELQEKVAEFARANVLAWQISDRVRIVANDIRDYTSENLYDVITFFNLIYYFPVDERIDVLRKLKGLLHPGGQVALTTLCPINEPSIQLMNLWSSMTKGCGPLPTPEEIIAQFKEAGFAKFQSEKLMPGFFLFKASMSG